MAKAVLGLFVGLLGLTPHAAASALSLNVSAAQAVRIIGAAACEGRDFSRARCRAVGCCRWDGQQCQHRDGAKQCKDDLQVKHELVVQLVQIEQSRKRRLAHDQTTKPDDNSEDSVDMIQVALHSQPETRPEISQGEKMVSALKVFLAEKAAEQAEKQRKAEDAQKTKEMAQLKALQESNQELVKAEEAQNTAEAARLQAVQEKERETKRAEDALQELARLRKLELEMTTGKRAAEKALLEAEQERDEMQMSARRNAAQLFQAERSAKTAARQTEEAQLSVERENQQMNKTVTRLMQIATEQRHRADEAEEIAMDAQQREQEVEREWERQGQRADEAEEIAMDAQQREQEVEREWERQGQRADEADHDLSLEMKKEEQMRHEIDALEAAALDAAEEKAAAAQEEREDEEESQEEEEDEEESQRAKEGVIELASSVVAKLDAKEDAAAAKQAEAAERAKAETERAAGSSAGKDAAAAKQAEAAERAKAETERAAGSSAGKEASLSGKRAEESTGESEEAEEARLQDAWRQEELQEQEMRRQRQAAMEKEEQEATRKSTDAARQFEAHSSTEASKTASSPEASKAEKVLEYAQHYVKKWEEGNGTTWQAFALRHKDDLVLTSKAKDILKEYETQEAAQLLQSQAQAHVMNGEEACERGAQSERQSCEAVGCCRWEEDERRCFSAVGTSHCRSPL